MLDNFYQGKRVLVTGHTGFKGAWLCEWLLSMGARVSGYSHGIPDKALFALLNLEPRLEHCIGDIRDASALSAYVEAVQPDVVFHLAAQPLVRLSYDLPLETFETNIMGTAHLLNALRSLEKFCACVVVTTDKCYENHEWAHGYRETDSMGGHDPYSASKGCAELVVASMRRSFFKNHPVGIASARAGNVIGGGDWAQDRIVPDCMRSLQKGEVIPVRNPHATRPWQHVLEPLGGYLLLGARLGQALKSGKHRELFADGFNFGPKPEANQSVRILVETILENWQGQWEDISDPSAKHEASLLNLAIDKAYHILDWSPVWDFEMTLEKTVEWYRINDSSSAEAMRTLTLNQIKDFSKNAPY